MSSVKRSPTDPERLARMQRMFDKTRAILAEDYDHFAVPAPTPRASTPPSKAVRKSAARSGRQGPKQS
jgi:hypothetical protein